MTGVAGCSADLLHPEQHGVIIAVDPNFTDPLDVSGGLSLDPELVAAAAEVGSLSGGKGRLPGLPVHEGEHEHLAGLMILDDGRNQSAGLCEVQLYHAVPHSWFAPVHGGGMAPWRVRCMHPDTPIHETWV